MKIDTDVSSVNSIKKDSEDQGKRGRAQKAESDGDMVTLTVDKKKLVEEENKSSAKASFSDIEKAEEAVGAFKGMLEENIDAAPDIHQLGEKSIVTLSED